MDHISKPAKGYSPTDNTKPTVSNLPQDGTGQTTPEDIEEPTKESTAKTPAAPTEHMVFSPRKRPRHDFVLEDVLYSEDGYIIPPLMKEAFDQLVGWANRGKHFRISDFNIVIEEKTKYKWIIVLKLATQNNMYHIVVSSHDGNDVYLNDLYLGGGAGGRRPRAGDSHAGGNDIADGRFNIDTWNRILADIVAYELVKHQSEHWKEQYMK